MISYNDRHQTFLDEIRSGIKKFGTNAIRLTFQNGNGIELLSTLLRSFSWGDNYYTELVSL